jgi:Family of unknown function (DUF6982)
VKSRSPTSTHKKVMVLLFEGERLRGYLNPAQLGRTETLDLLTQEGEHRQLPLGEVKSVHFVREFTDKLEPERKAFFSRPKLDGLWVRLRFRDNDTIEGIVPNELLEMLDHGVQITPPDLHGNSLRIFIPRAALTEMKALGVVGVARRLPRQPAGAALPQPKLFDE